MAIVVLGGARMFGGGATAKASDQAACIASLDCGDTSPVSPAAVTPAAPPSEAPPDDGAPDGGSPAPGKSPLDMLVDFGRGFVSQGGDTVTGLIDVVTHPVETIEGLAYVVTHPGETFDALSTAVVAAWNENPQEFLGRVVFEIVTLPVAAAKLSKLKVVTAVRDTAQAAGAARGLDKAADLARVAGAAADAAGQSLRLRLLERLQSLRRGAPVTEEVAFGWKDVNDFAGAGRGINCTRCAVAVDCTLGGAAACALPMRDALGRPVDDIADAVNPVSFDDLAQRHLGVDPSQWRQVADQQALVREVEAWGDGSKGVVGIVYTHEGKQAAHVFNVVNDHGHVMFFEGQSGHLGDANFLVDQIHHLRVIRTADYLPGTPTQALPLLPPP